LVIGERNFNSIDSENGSLNYLQNIGSVGNPIFSDFEDPVNTEVFGAVFTKDQGFINNYSAPCIVPVTDDFLLFTGTESGKIKLYNTIKDNLTGSFNILSEFVGFIQDGVRSTVAVADIDDDNYYEMITGNLRGGLTMYNTDIVVEESVSTSTNETEISEISIFPNPVETILTIGIPSTRENHEISILDIEGRSVYVDSNFQGEEINVAHFRSGVYFLHIKNERQSATRKFIKI
ncbi:MAG: T9SS type A sorting domain-containing protein, partial [Melioribacteraceae bacterium]|nr:T9SS type A sorting domain-containing protein [Melioribacteraceae bacterium]